MSLTVNTFRPLRRVLFTASSGTLRVWPNAVADGMLIGDDLGIFCIRRQRVPIPPSTAIVTYLKKDLTCYATMHMAPAGGYFDCFAVGAAGNESFTARIDNHQRAHTGYTQSSTASFHYNGAQTFCVCRSFLYCIAYYSQQNKKLLKPVSIWETFCIALTKELFALTIIGQPY